CVNRSTTVVMFAQYGDEISVIGEDRGETLAVAAVPRIFQYSDQLINGMIVVRHLFSFPSPRKAESQSGPQTLPYDRLRLRNCHSGLRPRACDCIVCKQSLLLSCPRDDVPALPYADK